MANAANMAIRKSILDRPFVIRGKSRSSGDDIFTLHAIAADNPGSIVFCRDPNSIVTTQPLYSFSGFFNQRIRWAGKWNSYNSLPTILLALFVFLVNILTISLPFLVIFEKISWLLLANLIIARILFEYLFLREIQKFFGNKILLHEFIILAIIYPFYVTITAIWGSLSGYKWKGRRTR